MYVCINIDRRINAEAVISPSSTLRVMVQWECECGMSIYKYWMFVSGCVGVSGVGVKVLGSLSEIVKMVRGGFPCILRT